MPSTTQLLKTRICWYCKKNLTNEDEYDYSPYTGWLHEECWNKSLDDFFSGPLPGHVFCKIPCISDIHFGDATEEEINAMSQIYDSVVLTGE